MGSHHCSLLAYLPALSFSYFELVLSFDKKRVIWLVLSSSSCLHWSLQSSPPLSMLRGHQSQDFCHCLDRMHGSRMDFSSSSSSEQGGSSSSSKESLAASHLAQESFGQCEVSG